MTDKKIEALADYLNVDSSEVKKLYSSSSDEYGYNNEEYTIYDENERDVKLCEYIENILASEGWIFNLKMKKYIMHYGDYDNLGQILWDMAWHPEEYLNREITDVVNKCAKTHFYIGNILTDMEKENEVGLLVSSYDGIENIYKYQNVNYYIYRLN